jgi:hypothetical protein
MSLGVIHLTNAWDWLTSQPPGITSFLGTLAGSSLGLLALLAGALFNAHLNRKRDDRLRKLDARGVAAALRAELAGFEHTLRGNADVPVRQDQAFVLPDFGESILVLPSLTDKLILLDGETIQEVLRAYLIVREYGDRLIMAGGVPNQRLPTTARLVALDGSKKEFADKLTMTLADEIRKAIQRLETYLA